MLSVVTDETIIIILKLRVENTLNYFLMNRWNEFMQLNNKQLNFYTLSVNAAPVKYIFVKCCFHLSTGLARAVLALCQM